MSGKTTVTFLGTCPNMPGVGEDSSCFVVNRRYLVDTGWCAALRMRPYGLSPDQLEHLFITHCHRDHTVGLPQLILYRHIARGSNAALPPLKIVGPAEWTEKIVRNAVSFLRFEHHPVLDELQVLNPGDTYETDEFRIATCSSRHTSPGLVYRFTDRHTGAEIGFTGDSQYDAAIVELVRGVSLLIHDVCYGDEAPDDQPGLHGRPKDAARTAAEAGVRRLALIHAGGGVRERRLANARKAFPNAFWPADGEVVEVEPPMAQHRRTANTG